MMIKDKGMRMASVYVNNTVQHVMGIEAIDGV